LLGPGEIDPLGAIRVAYVCTRGSTRPGATRELAEFLVRTDPSIFAVSGIDAGDACALATRFDRQWAYRGAQALFWKAAYRAHEVHDRYLPFLAVRPFDRRGLLLVDGKLEGRALSIAATQFSRRREMYVREARFAREQMRERPRFLLFAQHPIMRSGLRGRDAVELARDERDDLYVYARAVGPGDYKVMFASF
jgi:hypothetical protein